MKLLSILFGLDDKNTDFDKIHVTSNGTFYMESKDLFDDKSIELIDAFNEVIENIEPKKTQNK